MRYAWDQREVYFPPGGGPAARVRDFVLDRLRDWDARSNDGVDRFVANSSFVRDRIRRYYHRDADVVAPPVNTTFYDLADSDEPIPEEPFALSVASLAPYKRLDLAVEACGRLGLELRTTGRRPADESATPDGVRHLGRLRLPRRRGSRRRCARHRRRRRARCALPTRRGSLSAGLRD
jgi:glycosyltransferase involved in cell wall biosynthesis